MPADVISSTCYVMLKYEALFIFVCVGVWALTQCKVVYLRGQSHINQCRVVCVYIGLGQVGVSQSGEAAAEGGEEDR